MNFTLPPVSLKGTCFCANPIYFTLPTRILAKMCHGCERLPLSNIQKQAFHSFAPHCNVERQVNLFFASLLPVAFHENIWGIPQEIKATHPFWTLQCSEAVVAPQSSRGVKKETLAQVFSCEFCEILMNTFFYRTSLVAAFECLGMNEREVQ